MSYYGYIRVSTNTSRLWWSDSVKVLVHHEFKKDNVNIVSIEQPNYAMYTKDPNDFLFNGMMELPIITQELFDKVNQ